jgi:Ser/Thr protein kinase RdoA (MazF antagonist)
VTATPPSAGAGHGPQHRRFDDGADGPQIELPRGDVTEGVVRVGDTVRRPHQPQSLAVAGYLDHLERVGFEASPRYLGRDSQGRDVLTFLPGRVPGDPPEPWAADDDLLASVGALVRRLHDASAGYAQDVGFAAPAGSVWGRQRVTIELPISEPAPEAICHNDVTPQNVVVRDGVAVGLLDFDLAGPAPRLLDAYNTAMHWVPLRPPEDVWSTWDGVDQPARLRIFADAYRMSTEHRAELIDLGISRCEISWLRMRAAAEQLGGGWQRMWSEGVGDAIQRRKAWLVDSRRTLEEALLGR